MLNDFIDRGRRQGSFGEVALYTVHGSWWGSWRLMFIHVVYIYSRTRQFCNVRENFVVGPQGHLIRSSLYLYICHRVSSGYDAPVVGRGYFLTQTNYFVSLLKCFFLKQLLRKTFIIVYANYVIAKIKVDLQYLIGENIYAFKSIITKYWSWFWCLKNHRLKRGGTVNLPVKK